MIAIDIKLVSIKSDGTAYYRLPDNLFEFFKKCEKKHKIIGFEWDGSRNFGVILKDKNESND